MDNFDMLTTGDVARMIGVHINTIRRWESKGVLKSYRATKTGYRLFPRKDVRKFLDEISSDNTVVVTNYIVPKSKVS